jgi:hypothetical protein
MQYTEQQRKRKNIEVYYLFFLIIKNFLIQFFLGNQYQRSTNVGPVDYIQRMFRFHINEKKKIFIIIFL